MFKRFFNLAVLCVVFLASCQKGTDVTPSTNTASANTAAAASGTTTGSSTTTTAAVATNLNNTLLLTLVNNLRAKGCNCGITAMPAVNSLTWNDQLAAAALVHSKDMSATGLFSHNSSDGSTFDTRITAAGYKWMAVGENIAFGQTSEQEVFTAWLNSEGHCKNMMSANFKEMGAARVGNYWTQDFGSK